MAVIRHSLNEHGLNFGVRKLREDRLGERGTTQLGENRNLVMKLMNLFCDSRHVFPK
jgi:hypothetical protein